MSAIDDCNPLCVGLDDCVVATTCKAKRLSVLDQAVIDAATEYVYGTPSSYPSLFAAVEARKLAVAPAPPVERSWTIRTIESQPTEGDVYVHSGRLILWPKYETARVLRHVVVSVEPT